MISRIYTGHVRHRRFKPVRNEFRYRIFLMYLDLGELPHLFDDYRWWSVERLNVATFRRGDHFGDPTVSLDRAVRDLVAQRLGNRPTGPIRLLTHLRYFGYCFNPISIYYCFDREDRDVEAVVAEVHNTPWGEEHCYVFGQDDNEHPHPDWMRFPFRKRFHVSPFMEMGLDYELNCRKPGDRLSVHIMSFREEEKLFDATLALKSLPLHERNLTRALLSYPFMTAKVTAMIYWQALKLRFKGVPYVPHPGSVAPDIKGGTP